MLIEFGPRFVRSNWFPDGRNRDCVPGSWVSDEVFRGPAEPEERADHNRPEAAPIYRTGVT